jgi:hypothetical protein
MHLLRWISLVVLMFAFPGWAAAQTDTDDDIPELTEIFDGRGRLNGVTFSYPADWFTLEGIPVNRMISFNVVSSVQIGLRNQIEPGQEAIVLAVAGGRIDRWGDIEPGDTPEEILNIFFERLGDDSQFGGGEQPEEGDQGEFEAVTESFDLNGYEAVLVRFVEVESEDDAAPSIEDEVTEDDEEEFNGEFIAYSILLDDNRFMVVLVLTSELSYEDVQPTIDAILDTLTYSAD